MTNDNDTIIIIIIISTKAGSLYSSNTVTTNHK